MRYLSTLDADEKCDCQWYAKFDCYSCNRKELENRGGKIKYTCGKGEEYFLPTGQRVSYHDLIVWLKEQN